MTDDLLGALQEIHGVGEAKAREILDVVNTHRAEPSVDVDGLLANLPPGKGLNAARAYLEEQDHA